MPLGDPISPADAALHGSRWDRLGWASYFFAADAVTSTPFELRWFAEHPAGPAGGCTFFISYC